MAPLTLDTPIQYLRGVGPRRAEQFVSLGISTVGGLLTHFPHRYERDAGERSIADLETGVISTVRGVITRTAGRYPGFVAELQDSTGTVQLRWFHQARQGRGIYKGATVVATGTVDEYDGRLVLVQPSVQVSAPDTPGVVLERTLGLVGVYPASEQLHPLAIRRAIAELLRAERLPLAESLPQALRERLGLPDIQTAIRHMHMPPDEAAQQSAQRRLAYEEFLLLELGLALRRRKQTVERTADRLRVTAAIDARIRARFPFVLTAAQDAALRDVCRDLASGRPMTRLVQGDVGSGKTVVALYAALLAIAHQRQAAIMAPTEVLAQQHYQKIENYLAGSRVRRVLLRGGMPQRERSAAVQALASGEMDLVVGTQALLQKDVSFANLGLVVIDEQHKFGVIQRATFRTKGLTPHYLVMTATPIPRTLAMTLYGDLDVSLMQERPPGRGSIVTKLVAPAQWQTVMDYVAQRIRSGEQAYVVCPRVGVDEELASADASAQATGAAHPAGISARAAHARLCEGPWRGLRVGLLHGRMAGDQKAAVLAEFSAGALQALVATTVIEVGIDVPRATIMLIENAERFGLSQLHQLRGRVGRGSAESLCVLIPQRFSPAVRERLSVLVASGDGFRIAEADLRLRGPGELLGTRQHGLPPLHVGDLVRDEALLAAARADAFALIEEDPGLRSPQHALLRAALGRFLRGKLALIDAA